MLATSHFPWNTLAQIFWWCWIVLTVQEKFWLRTSLIIQSSINYNLETFPMEACPLNPSSLVHFLGLGSGTQQMYKSQNCYMNVILVCTSRVTMSLSTRQMVLAGESGSNKPMILILENVIFIYTFTCI